MNMFDTIRNLLRSAWATLHVSLWTLFCSFLMIGGARGSNVCITQEGQISSEDLSENPGATGQTGACDTLFGDQLNAIIATLTGPFALVIALVGFVGAGGALIFQNREITDFIKTLLQITLVACLLVLAGRIVYFFFGGGGAGMVL